MSKIVKCNVCYIINEKGEVLLQKKARGFGVGNWNGPGGKMELGETVEESVIREIFEETGIKLVKPELSGELDFIFLDEDSFCLKTFVFRCYKYNGNPEDKGEGELRWFKKEDIPLDKMWDDDKYWLLDFLNGQYVKKRFYFENNKVVKQEDL